MTMKSLNLKKFASMLVALASGASAYGQGTVANLTLKLTEYYTEEALLQKDEVGKFVLDEDGKKIPAYQNEYTVESSDKIIYTYETGSKIMTYKISNKEFLEALVYDGVISDIKGWAVVAVEYDGANTVYITKKDTDPINVSQYLNAEGLSGYADQESYKQVSTYTFATDSSDDKESGSYKAKIQIGIKSQFSSFKIDLQGVFDESAILKTFGKDEDRYTQWIPGARSATSLTGSLVEKIGVDEWDYEGSVVTGSISIAAGKLDDLSLYPDAVVN